jgi:UDP-glucose 4-epimerase
MSNPKSILVTGGAGFIGSHVVDRLVSEGCAVRVLDDLSSGKIANIDSHLSSGAVEFVKGDIRDVTLVSQSLKGIDSVIHLAAQISVAYSIEHPDETYDVNLGGTLNLLRCSALEGVKKFVLASSCAVYGDAEVLPIKEDVRPNPISPYAESKLLGERYCLGFYERALLGTVALRFLNVYGPRQGLNDYSGVITKFIDRVIQKKPLVIYGDGSQTRDFVNVKDIVEAIMRSTRNDEALGQVINVGTGKPTSINELAKTILELAGISTEIIYEKSRVGDIKDSYADISKAKKLLDYEPKVYLREGLRGLLEEKGVAV